jgi:hypothetical protein
MAVKKKWTLDFDVPVNGPVRKATVTARYEGGAVCFHDCADMSSLRERQKLADRLAGKLKVSPKTARERVERDWLDFIGRLDQERKAKQESGTDQQEEGGGGKKLAQADVLVALARSQSAELFHTPGGHDSEGFATIRVNGHNETWPVCSKAYRRWLARLYFERFERAPGSQALQDALNVIAGFAVHDGPECQAHVRLAEVDGVIWIDLADDAWRAVAVDADGWRVVNDPPVKFLRRRGMLPLPVPQPGGGLDELREMVNLPDGDAWIVYKSWLVGAFRPGRPFAILTVDGEPGSAKSTLCRMTRGLIDPNKAALRRPPREDRDLMIAATNSWVVAYDNLSGLPPALADGLCMLATGGGFGTRELYTDDDEKLFDATRPIMLNGIEDLATRSDVQDRSVNLTLPEIPDEKRRDEAELWRCYESARPRLLGALLDAVGAALRNLPRVRLPSKPRMADFALWSVAAAPALGHTGEAFLEAFAKNRKGANAQVIESSAVALAVLSLMKGTQEWKGTLKELLAELESRHTDENTRKRKDWPTAPRRLSGELRRVAPSLRREGISVAFGKHTKAGTPVTLGLIPQGQNNPGGTPSPPSPPSPASPDKDLRGDGRGDGGDGAAGQPSPRPSPPNPLGRKDGDGGDGGDGGFQGRSNGDGTWYAEGAEGLETPWDEGEDA